MLASVSLFAATEPKRVLVVHSFGSVAPPFMTFSTAFEAELVKRLGDSGGVRQDSGAGASGIYYECKRAVRLRFQRQLHTPNRR